MKRTLFQKIKTFFFSFFLGVFLIFPTMLHAAESQVRALIPSTVEPERVSENITSQLPTEKAPSYVPVAAEEEKAAALNKQAEKIKFKLTKIILEGNTVYSDQQLQTIYQDKLNTTISVAELLQIIQDITNYYRNNGYILSRAILPPQHVDNGVVRVRVLEGFIDKVNVIGRPRGAKRIVQRYADQITCCRPIQLKVLEHYLLLINQIPGVQARAVLEPSKTTTAASTLNLITDTKTFKAYVSYDNYGTRYIGPLQGTLGLEASSIFNSGDTTRGTYVQTTKGKELRYYDILYDTPFANNNNGLRGSIGTNKALTHPLFTLQPLDTIGTSTTYYTFLRYPLILERDRSLNIYGNFNYLNSTVTTLGAPLYTDHIRSVRAGLNYNFADRFRGSNNAEAVLSKGLNIFGATANPASTTLSRVDGHAVYTKFTLQYNRLQPIYKKFSAFATVQGQYAFEPLLAAEQFAVGGAQLGRAYDPAEIIGDRGAAASLELRLDTNPEIFLIHAAQFYVFYDAGVIWNIKNVVNVTQKQSLTSTGAGIRLNFMKDMSGNIMFEQPLTKQIASLQQIGNGRRPRIQFSVTAFLG